MIVIWTNLYLAVHYMNEQVKRYGLLITGLNQNFRSVWAIRHH
jgi:hypothetical protein